jgi:predicted nucleic acid-binding protein
MSVLLDSVIVIDHLNGIAAAGAYLASLRGASISVITRTEVLAGTTEQHAESVSRLLDNFPVLPIDRNVADFAATLRRTHRWGLPDAFQAALAQTHKLRLATRNTRDFQPSKHPWVIVPYVVK